MKTRIKIIKAEVDMQRFSEAVNPKEFAKIAHTKEEVKDKKRKLSKQIRELSKDIEEAEFKYIEKVSTLDVDDCLTLSDTSKVFDQKIDAFKNISYQVVSRALDHNGDIQYVLTHNIELKNVESFLDDDDQKIYHQYSSVEWPNPDCDRRTVWNYNLERPYKIGEPLKDNEELTNSYPNKVYLRESALRIINK